MPGSMREKRPGAWGLRVFVGRDENDGRVRHRSRMFEGSKRAAERELARLVAEVEERAYRRPIIPTGWGRDYHDQPGHRRLEAQRLGSLSPNTTNRYDGIWRNYIAEIHRPLEDRPRSTPSRGGELLPQ